MLLPCFFCSDNLPVICLGAWHLNSDFFDSDILKGPAPTLFAEDPDLALPALQAYPLKVHADLVKIMRCFFIPETFDTAAAMKFVKNPRMGAAFFPFKVPAWKGPEPEPSPGPSSTQPNPNKRPRLDNNNEAGTLSLL